MNQQKTWQVALSEMITDADQLLKAVDLTAEQVGLSLEASDQFSCRVPLGYVEKIKLGDPEDPLLLQVLPTKKELLAMPGYSCDPLNESCSNPVQGLLHKYHGRVLLTVASSCAINCRYCFRRHFPYEENSPGTKGWGDAISYVTKNNTISEVIFSGGDPLMLKDKQLSDLANQFSKISHVKRLRIHTRLPVVIPSRVTDELCDWLEALPLQTVVVLHCNHPNEIDQEFLSAMNRLKQSDVTLLNQSVILKNINDNVQTLCELSEKLFECGVLPYYLHLLDKVAGAWQFYVPEESAIKLLQQVRDQLPGFLVPKLVREDLGANSKTRLD